jgi:PhnB protein
MAPVLRQIDRFKTKRMVVAEKKKVQRVPEGYTAITPWIISPDSARLIRFLKTAFEAEEIPGSRMASGNGKITHVEVKIGDAIVMLFDSAKDWPPTPAFIRLYVDNCDTSYQKAIKAGARAVTKPTMLAFGDKVGRIADPFGNVWWIQERIEDMSHEDPNEMMMKLKDASDEKSMKYVEDSLHAELKKRSHPASL